MDKERVRFTKNNSFRSHGIKFTDQIQITEYDDEFEISDDESEKNKKLPINPLLKRLYIRTNSQDYSRIRYFSKEQEKEEMRKLEEDSQEKYMEDNLNPPIMQDDDIESNKYDKIDDDKYFKDEFEETDDKGFDFDLNIEIPDDEVDFQMQTPVRRNKDEEDSDE